MADFIAHTVRLDLDKTYLRSEFDTMADLLKSAMESPSDKQAFPGAPALLRSLKQNDGLRICIVSGSPTQMRQVLAAKLALDGIDYDEFVLKNNLRNIVRGRFRALRAQVPYKLPTLLASRVATNVVVPETLFGDDAEADAMVYALYADVLAGNLPRDELVRILQAARAYDDEVERTLELAASVVHQDSVQRILIHLDQRSPTASFAKYGARLVPIYNYFQAALILYADGLLSARQVLFVGLEMLASPEFEIATLANSLQDLLRRGRLSRDVARRLAAEAAQSAENVAEDVTHVQDLPPFEYIATAFRDRVRQLGDAAPLEWPAESPRLDYVSLVDAEHQERRHKRKHRTRSRKR